MNISNFQNVIAKIALASVTKYAKVTGKRK